MELHTISERDLNEALSRDQGLTEINYSDMISDDTTLVLTTDSDLFRFRRGMQVEADPFLDPGSDLGDGGVASTGRARPAQNPVSPIVTQAEVEVGR
ncbi:hypothetical protein N4R57_04390 [Rhodobacteraceae bacterium D3-12]|nr:hypothetical protein N4R57_04390 [Rhodobacteraceae bacterium D3-12]